MNHGFRVSQSGSSGDGVAEMSLEEVLLELAGANTHDAAFTKLQLARGITVTNGLLPTSTTTATQFEQLQRRGQALEAFAAHAECHQNSAKDHE